MYNNGGCLVNEFRRFQQSSQDAVVHASDFDQSKEVFHVKRECEESLIQILKEIHLLSRPQLVLVCGSVGDGKSHLIGYIKRKHPELMENVQIHNDATESYKPNQTSDDTLHDLLEKFRDDTIGNNFIAGKHLIVAINLGKLSNFLSSKYNIFYKRLKDYIRENKVLDEVIQESVKEKNLPIHHINLSDYHLYELTEKGVRSKFQEMLLSKITSEIEDNPIYQVYKENCLNSCPVKERCPVKRNYELLKKTQVQSSIINRLAELSIKYKVILSPRVYLDSISSIVVKPKIIASQNAPKLIESFSDQEYIESLLPNQFFALAETNDQLKKVVELDPCLNRSEELDDMTIRFFNTDRLYDQFLENIDENDLKELGLSQILQKDIEEDLKSDLYLTLLRLNFFGVMKDRSLVRKDEVYEQFLQYLYYWNKGDDHKIRALIEDVKEAVVKWNGGLGGSREKSIRLKIGRNQSKFYVYQSISLKYQRTRSRSTDEDILDRFLTRINLNFKEESSPNNHSVSVDYNLYKLINKIKKGYIPNHQDQNLFIHFVHFINKLSKDGSQRGEVKLYRSNSSSKRSYVLKLDEFNDYVFDEEI